MDVRQVGQDRPASSDHLWKRWRGRPVNTREQDRWAEGEIVLTAEGRHLLAERARRLREKDIPTLALALQDPERDRQVDMDYERAGGELRRLLDVLDRARRSLPRRSDHTVGSPEIR